jgi:hypothetical protein
LLRHCQIRLDQKRVSEKSAERRGIGNREKAVWLALNSSKPSLQQRARARKDCVRNSDRCHQEQQDAERWVEIADLPAGRCQNGKNRQTDHEKADVDEHLLARREPCHEAMRVSISKQ